jgi:hypothetical protein
MGDILNKIRSNFLGQNNFSVGFNNNSPVKGISRKASPLNNYQSSASFSGPTSAVNSNMHLLSSAYGRPQVPDNEKMGEVLSDAVGQFGYMGYHVSDELGKLLGADGEGGSPWHRKASPLNENGDENGDDDPEIETSIAANVDGADIVVDDTNKKTNVNLNSNLPGGINADNSNYYANQKYEQTWGEGSYGTPDSWKRDADGKLVLDADGNKIKVKGISKPHSISARIESMEWW